MPRLRKYKITDPSADIAKSYMRKAQDCLRAAKLLYEATLHENAISQSYFGMYCSALAALQTCGIHGESHEQTITLLTVALARPDLARKLQNAKRERIEKQYFITSASADRSAELIVDAERFILEVRLIIDNLTPTQIEEIRRTVGNSP